MKNAIHMVFVMESFGFQLLVHNLYWLQSIILLLIYDVVVRVYNCITLEFETDLGT